MSQDAERDHTALTGRCLCGAVRIRVTRHAPAISACHCTMCRRWSGSVMLGFDAPSDAVDATGPVHVYASSAIGERAFCGTCGSHLWFRGRGDAEDGLLELAPGLFDEGGLFMARELYIDAQPHGIAFAGDHERLTKQQYEAEQPFVAVTSANEGDVQ